MPADPYTLRCEAERLVGEDRVPAEELERLCHEYGDIVTTAPPSRTSWLRHRAAMIFVLATRRIADRHLAETPAALLLDGAKAVEALFNAAHDSELAMLDEIVVRSGLGWRCQAELGGEPCECMNVGFARCWCCGAGEPAGRKDPDG